MSLFSLGADTTGARGCGVSGTRWCRRGVRRGGAGVGGVGGRGGRGVKAGRTVPVRAERALEKMATRAEHTRHLTV